MPHRHEIDPANPVYGRIRHAAFFSLQGKVGVAVAQLFP
jgi:hypothetical protein